MKNTFTVTDKMVVQGFGTVVLSHLPRSGVVSNTPGVLIRATTANGTAVVDFDAPIPDRFELEYEWFPSVEEAAILRKLHPDGTPQGQKGKISAFKLKWHGQWCVFEHVDSALEEAKAILIEDPDAEEVVTVELVRMTREELNALPEFPGW